MTALRYVIINQEGNPIDVVFAENTTDAIEVFCDRLGFDGVAGLADFKSMTEEELLKTLTARLI
jgi:hypothetical protein